ncbi:hypothetical protein [Halioxenophilus sp. WMMB6]|uniref:hypothetical protein n=1 Tax=Halioxenophilus sp. WMMB6 TaxID=3073815 RepID=UPI00295EB6BB|nr:hypothetical protein [Halioxenophilus sp. WMMB6]
MNFDNQNNAFDERVDRYLRGKMTEAEELEFEIEYLDNPRLLAEVEMVERLMRGLELNKSLPSTPRAATTTMRPVSLTDTLKQWLSDWFTPQTAWGAAAAAIVLVPLMSIISPELNTPADAPTGVQPTYVHLLGQKVRSLSTSEDVIYLEPEQKNLVIGFTSEPSFGVPEPVTVNVYDANDQLVWHQDGLLPDYRWTVYLSVNATELKPGEYRYELLSEGEAVSQGQFAMQYTQ